MVKVTESPRDGMQSFHRIIPLREKVLYVNTLTDVGFDIIDIGSFVSPKAVPQMADTGELIEAVELRNNTEISVLVGNARYAEAAVRYDKVKYINYPFSVSEVFLEKNLRSNFEKSYVIIDNIINLCEKHNKQPVITLSMAFGNPYGEAFSSDILLNVIGELHKRGLRYIPLADTTAEADAESVGLLISAAVEAFSDTEFNLHLHTYPQDIYGKLSAAHRAGCRSFDTVFNGVGGCPMSGKELTANTDTVIFAEWLKENNIPNRLNSDALSEAQKLAMKVFA